MKLSERVARRFFAELLTKQWLMGIRRGWLSLLKPEIRNWEDVFKAFQRLIEFVTNLREQVNFIRKAPTLVLTDFQKDNREAIEALFKKLIDTLKEKESSAKHWHRVSQGGLGDHGFPSTDGDKMFALYQEKFGELLEVSLKSKVNPAKGQWNSTRQGHITELLDKLLELLREQAAVVNKDKDLTPEVSEETEREWGTPSFREFDYGGMKVVVTDPKFHGKLIDRYIKFIDDAYHVLSSKGFKKLWYGVMFIESSESEKLSEYEQAAYARLGYKDMRARAGKYHEGQDVFFLTQAPTPWVTESIVHELGHRYWFRFMSSRQRALFESLVKVHPEAKPHKLPFPDPVLPYSTLTKIQDDVERASRDLVEKAITQFEKSRNGWKKDLDESSYLYGAALKFNQKVVDLRAEFKAAYVEKDYSKWKALIAKQSEFYSFMFDVDQTIKNKMDSMPEPEAMSYVPEGKNPWQTVYEKKLRPEWVAEARERLAKLLEDTGAYLHEVYSDYNAKAKKDEAAYNAEVQEEPVDEEGFAVNDPRTVLPVSDYGRSHIREAFAEVFTYYVLGHEMNRDQLESFKSVISSRKLTQRQLFKAFLEVL